MLKYYFDLMKTFSFGLFTDFFLIVTALEVYEERKLSHTPTMTRQGGCMSLSRRVQLTREGENARLWKSLLLGKNIGEIFCQDINTWN